jgi:hypothetical protein
MNSPLKKAALLAACLLSMRIPANAQTAVNWTADPLTPANWNLDGNWTGPSGSFVPSAEFDEVAVISNGGTAWVADTPPNTGGITINSGLVEIRTGGNLTSRTGDGEAANGAVNVGGSGLGRLSVLSGGVLNAPTIGMGGSADSELFLSGTASLNIAGNASLTRVTRIQGPSVSFEVGGNLTVNGRFVPVITGANHTAIDVFSGQVTLGGVLQPEFSGVAPTLGQSWTLIDAATVSGQFASIDSSQATGLARGAAFGVSYNQGGNGNVVLSLDSKLILSVNRANGAARIENALGGAKAIQGYSIQSPSGTLAPESWTSLEDAGEGAWQEANPTANALSELNPLGTTSLAVGATRNLGDILAPSPTKFGELLTEDATFTYVTSAGQIVPGIIEYTGGFNTLVLVVNPETGESALNNQSSFAADIQGYTISSASGSLLPANSDWNSLEDQDLGAWDEANPTPFNLSELNPLGSALFNSGRVIPLGTPFATDGERDLSLSFVLTDGTIFDGVVQYGELPDVGQIGDTNGDGAVNLNDLNNVRNFFGNSGAPGIPGDSFPFDGVVNLNDLNAVRNNFGAGASSAPVPEPSTFALATLLGASLAVAKRRRRKNL